MRLFLTLWLVTASIQTVLGDQCKWVSRREANAALTVLKEQPELVLYCHPCDKQTKTKLQLDSTYIQRVNSRLYALGIIGKTSADGTPINKTVDLAYTYINEDGYALSLASKLDLSCEHHMTDRFLWPMVGNEAPKPPDDACFDLVKHESEVLKRVQEMYPCQDVMLTVIIGRKTYSEKLLSTEMHLDRETNGLSIVQKSESFEICYLIIGQFITQIENIRDSLHIDFTSADYFSISTQYQGNTLRSTKAERLIIPYCDKEDMLLLALTRYAACCRQ